MSKSRNSLLKVIIIIKLDLDITEIRINEGLLMNTDQKIYSDNSGVNKSIKAI